MGERIEYKPAIGENLPVRIREGGEVDYDVVNLRKSADDTIVWTSLGNSFTVHFPNTPFDDDTFHVSAGGKAYSGPVRPDAKIGLYEYVVTDIAMAKSADPGANIVP
jgi:hypothetical protein